MFRFRCSGELPGFERLERFLLLKFTRFYKKMTTDAVIDKRIPDKWRDYKPCGIPIRGERIIAFKTPLSHRYDNESDRDNGIKPHERFTPMDLLNHLNQKHIKLGMVVDFTNTNRYYDGMEFSDYGILHCKIKCVGKEIPDEDVVSRFKTEVCTFMDKNTNSDALIGVHCTHGLNRAGYVVCRYLIECRGYTPEKAIKAFNKARGHDMERENYLEDLHKRIPKSDGASFVRNGDKSRGREIPLDKPRYVHTSTETFTRHVAYDRERINRRPAQYSRRPNEYDYFGSHYHHDDRYQSTGNPTQSRYYAERRFTNTQHRDNNYDNNYDRNYHNPESYYRDYSENNHNDYGYSHSGNNRNYDRGYHNYDNYASYSRPGRNREESYRRDHVMRTSSVRDRPKPYSQQRTRR